MPKSFAYWEKLQKKLQGRLKHAESMPKPVCPSMRGKNRKRRVHDFFRWYTRWLAWRKQERVIRRLTERLAFAQERLEALRTKNHQWALIHKGGLVI